MQPILPKQVCARPIVCFIKNTLTWDHIAMRNKMVRNVFPNHKFKNNMFHSRIGTRNKTVLIYQFGNNVFHSQIGTRNKTVLIYQFRNNVFHSRIGTRNKTVLIYQRVLMGVPSYQLTTNFSAKCQLTAIFLANCQLTTNSS